VKADTDLVRSCLEGDAKAFGELLDRYERPVFNAALRMLGNRDDAADVTQTVFLRAWESLATYDPERRFYSWIYRIAINESLRAVERRRPHDELPNGAVSHDPGPDARLSDARLADTIQKALLVMTPDYRAVIVMRHFLDASYQEMADALGVPEKTVKSRLFTARRRLRELLEAEGVLKP
jgi:RNA polymerase sigma-70 factor (ECF subfamily)